MTARARPHSINQVLARLIGLHFLLPMLSLTLLSLILVGYLEGQKVGEQQLQRARSIAYQTDIYLEQAHQTLAHLACAAQTSPPKVFDRYLQSAQFNHYNFDTLYELDPNCSVLHLAPQNPQYLGLDMSRQSYCQAKSPPISRPFHSPRTNQITVYMRAPIQCAPTQSPQSNGIIVGELTLNQIQQVLNFGWNPDNQEKALLIDRNGTLLAGPHPEQIAQQVNLGNLPVIQQALLKPESNFYYWEENTLIRGSSASVPRTGWVVIIQGPVQTVYRSVIDVILLSIALFPGLWLILLLIVQQNFHRNLVTPLAQLSQKAYALAAGNFAELGNDLIADSNITEIEVLKSKFYQMGLAIQGRQMALQTSEERYRQRTAQLETLRQVGLKITAQLEPESLLNSIVSRTIEIFQADQGVLLLYNSERNSLEWGIAIGKVQALAGMSIRCGEGLTGKIWQSGRAMVINNYMEWEERLPQVHPGLGLISILGVPIYWGDAFLGVLLISAETPSRFSPEDVELLNLLATQAAIAIHNAQTLTEEATQRRRAEALAHATGALTSTLELQPLLENGLRAAQQAIPVAERGTILLFNEKTGELEIQAVLGYSLQAIANPVLNIETCIPIQQCLEEGPQLIADSQSLGAGESLIPQFQIIRSEIMAPLRYRDELIGIISLSNVTRKAAFTAADLTLLAAFADQTAMAVANAWLFRKAQLERTRLSTLYEASRLLAGAPTLEETIKVIIQRAHYVGAESCDLILLDLGGYPLLRSTHLEHNALAPEQVATYIREITTGGLQAWTLAQRRSALVTDTRQDPRWLPPLISNIGPPVRSALCIPLTDRRNQVLGFLNYGHSAPNAFSIEEQQLAEEIGARVSIAIENAGLYDEARQRLAREERLNELAHTLSGEVELSRLISPLLHGAAQLSGADAASLALYDPERREIISPYHYNLPMLGEIQEPLARALAGPAVKQRDPVQIVDYPQTALPTDVWTRAGIRTVLTLPLIASNEVQGALTLFSLKTVRPFSLENQLTAQAIARLAAVAIQRAQLFTAERQSRHLAEALATAAFALSSTLDLEQVLDRILEQVAQVVLGDAFNIMLLNNGQIAETMRRRGYERFSAAKVPLRTMAVEEYPTLLRMIESGRPVVVIDTVTEPGWVADPDRPWLRSYIGAPIRFKDRTIGFLNVNGSHPGQFTHEDAEQLAAFASQVAAALENARLFRELQGRAEHLEQVVQERTAEIRAQYARLEAILRSTSDGIIVADPQGELLQVNPVVQSWLTQTLSPEDAARLRQAIRELAPRVLQRPQKVVELKGLDLELTAAPISAAELEQEAVVIAVHDVSHLKTLDRLKSSLISNVSHELRTPITSIQLYTSLLRRGKPERWNDYLEALEKEASRQARLIEDVLQISRIDAGRLEIAPRPVPLNDLALSVLVSHQVLAQNANVDLMTRLTQPSPMAYIDSDRMMQVLNNLVENALRHTPTGGQVEIITGATEAKERGWATLTVADSGIGIPPDELDHIFERFFRGSEPQQRQIPGTGLGLAIVKEIVELHGGWVTVTSQVGVGSTFTVWVPLTDSLPQA